MPPIDCPACGRLRLEYGTNEGSDLKFDRDKYAVNLTRTLTNMRSVFVDSSTTPVTFWTGAVYWHKAHVAIGDD